MRDREFYATILGVEAPRTVERVELDVAGGAVHVWLARTEDAAAQCPECQTACCACGSSGGAADSGSSTSPRSTPRPRRLLLQSSRDGNAYESIRAA